MNNNPNRFIFPVILSIILIISVFYLFDKIIATNSGMFVYVLDDPYIHMATAKNLVGHSVFGVTKHEFSSGSSSPLWTLLIAAFYWSAGESIFVPFLLNIILSVILVFAVFSILDMYDIKPLISAAAGILIIFAGSLLSLIFTGMEHILHSLLFLIFILMVSENSTSMKAKPNPLSGTLLYAVAFLVTAVRYESAFVVFIAGILFIARKNIRTGLILWTAGALPLIIMGVVSVMNGWYFLPNSILLKGNTGFLSNPVHFLAGLVYMPVKLLTENPFLLVLFAGPAIYLAVRRTGRILNDKYAVLAILYILQGIFHLDFAQTGWFYRYEAYLVISGIVINILLFRELSLNTFKIRPSGNIAKISIALFFAVILSPFFMRAKESCGDVVKASNNIYCQQIQMAGFIGKYYSGRSVALNDVGAVNYYDDINCVDIFGLININTAKAKFKNEFDTKKIDEILKKNNTKLAVIYDSWFYGHTALPRNWIKAGEWYLDKNVICGDDHVSFYAPDSLDYGRLKSELKNFSLSLPENVNAIVY